MKVSMNNNTIQQQPPTTTTPLNKQPLSHSVAHLSPGDLVWIKENSLYWPARIAKLSESNLTPQAGQRLVLKFANNRSYAVVNDEDIDLWENEPDVKAKAHKISKSFYTAKGLAEEWRNSKIYPKFRETAARESSNSDLQQQKRKLDMVIPESSKRVKNDISPSTSTPKVKKESTDNGKKVPINDRLMKKESNVTSKEEKERRKNRRVKVMRKIGLCTPDETQFL